MTGPFKPEDFTERDHGLDIGDAVMIADHVNRIFACPKGGEHEPVDHDDEKPPCWKCLTKLRSRWEAL